MAGTAAERTRSTICAVASAPGAGERAVVRASGPTAHTVEVHEPNMKSDRLPIVDDVEDAIFGEKYPEKSNIPENRRISTSK